MFDAIFNMIKDDVKLPHLATVIARCGSLVELFSEQYLKDKNTKNACIDAIVQVLQAHKDASDAESK